MIGISICAQESSANFIHNDGQWDNQIDFKLPLNTGDIYFEKTQITYSIYDKSLYGKAKHGEYELDYVPAHAYRVMFIHSNQQARYVLGRKKNHHYNFLNGNDANKWKSKVKAYDRVYVKDIYTGVDYTFYEYYGQTKYDFIVHPEGNPSDIQLSYEGLDGLKIKKGHLVLETSVGEIIEQSPYAYQFIDGKEVQIPCDYNLNNNVLSFVFPEGYDPSLELTIDPVLTFATYTGSSADNFGCTATDDLNGNMLVGGTVFGAGYPTSTGAYQVSFSGGNIDMGITKYTADGTSLVYSTYLGGTGNEIPHSLVVNQNDELIILGTSNSTDYPISATAFQSTMNSGTGTTWGGYGFNYNAGCDIVVTKLNVSGTGIIGSTYLGGTGNDGLNEGSLLHYNYGDAFRGEIINGLNGEIIIASTTSSPDFPVTSNAPQSSLNGPSDAILVQLSSDLSSLLFATYIGGSDRETGNSVQLNSTGEMYLAGGTLSADFPGTTGGFHSSYQGGTADGYVARFSANGSNLLNASYIGTSNYDQNYFVQTDLDDDVYMIGQTDGNYPIFNAAYSNPNSGQYIQKLTPDLSTSLLSTTIGRGNGTVDIAVNAFLVSDCDFIYLSGWGGSLNGYTSLGAHATSSTTLGMPITADAFQWTTDGSDFYLAVLAPDASSLLYATFFGGGTSHEHADGGTSRFDKSGTVYQAVCAGCGGNSDFPTTAGAWSNTNNALNCNLGAFKFDLGSITPSISVPQPYVCLPSAYQFNNNSSGGNEYHWYFGDGDSSSLFEPAHTYQDTGHYEVTLIVADSTGCLQSDTTALFIDVFALGNASVSFIDTICRGDSAVLTSTGGVTYQWFPPSSLSSPNSQTTYAFPSTTTQYMVIATDSCGLDTALITVPVFSDNYSVMDDTLICSGFPLTLEAYGGSSYNWQSDPSMQNPGSQTPTVTPNNSTMYYVEITMASGCIYNDSVFVETINSLPVPSMTNDTTICLGDQITLSAQGGTTYIWSPTNLLTNINGASAQTNIQSTSQIFVEISNPCGTVLDSVIVEVIEVFPEIVDDTIICPGDLATLWASGGSSYSWTPVETLSSPNNDTTLAQPVDPTTYQVLVENTLGCSKTLDVFVNFHLIPIVQVSGPSFVLAGQEIELIGTTNATNYYWESDDSLLCTGCYSTLVIPDESSYYYFTAIDTNGCKNTDSLEVLVESSLFVPNSFTPDGNGTNDYFRIEAREVHDFQLYIFNRWGQLIYESTDPNDFWDGTYKGKPVQVDAYVWKIDYLDNQEFRHEFIGHVSVIR
ncbi:MAG: gliding motility-associated C-terminal domain-containing protein [Flavobacteriales bacterium]|nr:gliding motility-associated C-terminal domain-containing protein [Flavobacteriales bacterium]MCB9196336.1 gliding motility-associated C-terminal domain-containing protein [Flavobacteriales bacterium]